MRKAFAKNFLVEKIGAGVRILQGLVIPVGDFHTLATACKGAQNTIPDDRVYHLA